MKRFRARIWSVLLSLVLVMGSVATNGQTASAKAKIKLNKTSVTLKVGKKATIKVKNTKKKAKWSIKSGKKFITLKKKKKSSVVVKAKKAGTAKVVAKVGGKKLTCKIKVKAKGSGDSVEDNDPIEGDATPVPNPSNSSDPSNPDPTDSSNPMNPNQTSTPGVTNPPTQTNTPGVTNPPTQTNTPGVTNPPTQTDTPGVTNPPIQTNTPGVTNPPNQTSTPGVTNPPSQTSSPGQNVELPSGATKFTLGTRELAIGMSRSDVNTVLGGNSTYQEVRTGKAPQGFDTISYNTANCQEYLLIYLQNDKVVGIYGIGKSMSYGDVVAAGQNGNNLSGWTNNTQYKTDKKSLVCAKEKKISTTEQVYAFYDALGDNTVYSIQVFDPTSENVRVVSQNNNNMIYMTSDNTYGNDVTTSIATEIGYILNAFRMYCDENAFVLHSGLAQCAQNYCNSASSSKLSGRGDPALIDAIEAAGTDPSAWGEACAYDAADAISFANTLIEVEDFYLVLNNIKVVGNGRTPIWDWAGVGMASNGKHTYVTVDYIES